MPLRGQRGLESHQEHRHSLGGDAGRKSAMWVRQARGQRVPALPCSGCWCRVAAHQRPFLLWDCSLSTAWFLQDDSKQRALTALSENGGSPCRSPGEFWKKRQDGSSFLLNQHICRTEDGAAAALCPEEVGAHQERQKSLGPFKNDEHSRCCLPQLCPQNRAHGSPLPR